MAGRASIVGAAATHVGKVRDHNEDAHFIDADLGVFLVCDGMGGHAAGEVASELAIEAIRREWGGETLREVVERWLERGTPEAKKELLDTIRDGVIAAHDSILAEADRDETKSGMGTTLVGAVIVGGELVFAHAGDSRAYLVRDGISMQLTEDHTLLARLLAAGIDVDVSGEGSRFRSMLTNALGIGDEVKVSTFVVPLADGDRFLLCSDGVSEYVPENEVGDVLVKHPSPGRAAQQLIDLALERGGGDNATAVVVRVLEAGETPLPAEQRKRDDAAIKACALWGKRLTPQQRLRALRIAIPRDHNFGERLPPHALGDRVAWIILEGELVQDGEPLGPGALIYPESLLGAREAGPAPGRDALAITRSDVRALAIRANDFHELCDDDGELGEGLLESLAAMIARRRPRAAREPAAAVDPRGNTDPNLPAVPRSEAPEAYHPTDPNMAAVGEPEPPDARDASDETDDVEVTDVRDRAATVPDDPSLHAEAPPLQHEGATATIAPALPRAPQAPQPPVRPSPPPQQLVRRATPPPPPPPSRSSPPSRPSPPPAPRAGQPPSRPSPLPESVAPRQAGQAPSRPSPLPESPSESPVVPLAVRGASQPPSRSSRPSPPPEPPSSESPQVPLTPRHAAQAPGRPNRLTPPPWPPRENPPEPLTPRPAQPPVRPSQPLETQPRESPPEPLTPRRAGQSQPSRESSPEPLTPRRAGQSQPSRESSPEPLTPRRAAAAPGRPSRPSQPPEPAPIAGAPDERTLTPVPASAAAVRPRAPTPGQGVARPQPSAQRTTPGRGFAPVTGEAPVKPAAQAAAAAPRTVPARSGAAWEATARMAESPWDGDTARDGRAAPSGFARAVTPPPAAKPRRASTPVPARADSSRRRPPTDPEIETYLEIEAELPPEPGAEPDLESEFALSALADLDDEHESVSIMIEQEGRRVIETTTETDAHTLTVTVTESLDGLADRRAITAEDGSSVSGTISIPEDTPPPPPPRRRAKRQSDGWDD